MKTENQKREPTDNTQYKDFFDPFNAAGTPPWFDVRRFPKNSRTRQTLVS